MTFMQDHVLCKQEWFDYLLSNMHPFYFFFCYLLSNIYPFYFFFSCLMDLAKTFSNVLNSTGDNEHVFLFLVLSENAYATCGLSIYSLYCVEECSFYAKFTKWFIMKECCIWSDTFSAAIESKLWFLFFSC